MQVWSLPFDFSVCAQALREGEPEMYSILRQPAYVTMLHFDKYNMLVDKRNATPGKLVTRLSFFPQSPSKFRRRGDTTVFLNYASRDWRFPLKRNQQHKNTRRL